MIKISSIKMAPVKNEPDSKLLIRCKTKLSKLLGIKEDDIKSLSLIKKSIDARKKDNVVLVLSLLAQCNDENKIISKNRKLDIKEYKNFSYNPYFDAKLTEYRPVVVGFGPAGMLCAYILALNGLKPIVIERGKCIEERDADVTSFWNGGELNPESNVQFGEGGAGTFSDGKLNTQIKDPDGRIAFVLKTFVEFGAPLSITYDQKPHIGTDILKDVVTNIRKRILELGGEIYFSSKLTDICIKEGTYKLDSLIINNDNCIKCNEAVLAIGHSARDTFRVLKNKVLMECKDFAVGYRVMHSQKSINMSQYGDKFFDYFGAAPYKLTAKSSLNKGVYSFCMCPGGYVVNSSSCAGMLCINGMSYNGRDSSNANSAIIVQVGKEDYINELKDIKDLDINDPLLGVYFQERIEKKAYNKESGAIPVQLFKDFKDNSPSFKEGSIKPCIKGRFKYSNLRGILPKTVEESFVEGMNDFGKSIKGFDGDETVLAGIEGRTSSPVRIVRDCDYYSNIKGLYPCGEGAGYAGGIISASVDGIKTAEKLIENRSKGLIS